MRPVSIVRFDRLYLASIVLWIVGHVINWSSLTARIDADPGLAPLRSQVILFVAIMLVVISVVALGAWYGASRLRSGVARVVAIIVTAFGALLIVGGVATGSVVLDAGNIVHLVAVVMQVSAVTQLFRPDAAAWFAPLDIVEDDA